MCRNRTRIKIIGVACICILLLIGARTLHKNCLQPSISHYKILEPFLVDSDHNDGKKYILFWTNFFTIKFWGMERETLNESYFESINCPVTNCIFTHNKNLRYAPHMYDAMVFHGAESWSLIGLPSTRSANQVYIMASMESPGEIKHNMALDHDFFNLTMTYRLDSDIIWPYAHVIDLESGSSIAPSLDARWRSPDENFEVDDDVFEMIKGKQKTAAWFVSHCNVISKRDNLTQSLQKFIDVDIYGKCGNLRCPRGSNYCDSMLNTTYKFYLAFENTLCIDYVTEKLFNAMNNYIIPIVYSGANLSRFVPPKSYIDANEFDSVEHLTNYLKYLSLNPQEYSKFFWWKKYYKIVAGSEATWCNLCRKINEQNFKQKRQYYINIKDWWYKGSCKRNPDIKF